MDQSAQEDNPEIILGTYKQMMAECQQLASKIQELSLDKDEHRLVIDQLSKLDHDKRAFRYIFLNIFDYDFVKTL